ncbi:hypothetical protein BT67DRAFT_439087, partial [Trichocladium antarcticum]
MLTTSLSPDPGMPISVLIRASAIPPPRLSLNCRSGASFPAPVPPPSHAHPTASQCTVEVYAGVATHPATCLRRTAARLLRIRP